MHDAPYFYGCRPQSRRCVHRGAKLADAGHPNPCGQVRWVANHHVVPIWQDGECDDFQPTAEETAKHAGEPVAA